MTVQSTGEFGAPRDKGLINVIKWQSQMSAVVGRSVFPVNRKSDVDSSVTWSDPAATWTADGRPPVVYLRKRK